MVHYPIDIFYLFCCIAVYAGQQMVEKSFITSGPGPLSSTNLGPGSKMVKAIDIHVFMFLIIKKILKFAGSCWLKETSNTHGKDLLIDGRAPRHGEIMKMPKLAQTFKVFKK